MSTTLYEISSNEDLDSAPSLCRSLKQNRDHRDDVSSKCYIDSEDSIATRYAA